MTNRYLKAALFFGFALFSADANVPFPAASTANTLVASVDWLFKDYEPLFKSLGVDPKPTVYRSRLATATLTGFERRIADARRHASRLMKRERAGVNADPFSSL